MVPESFEKATTITTVGLKKSIDKMLSHILYRKMGPKLIRISTPLHQVRM